MIASTTRGSVVAPVSQFFVVMKFTLMSALFQPLRLRDQPMLLFVPTAFLSLGIMVILCRWVEQSVNSLITSLFERPKVAPSLEVARK